MENQNMPANAGGNSKVHPIVDRALEQPVSATGGSVSNEFNIWTWFDDRQHKLIENCRFYAANDPAGLPGHSLMMIIAKFRAFAEVLLSENARLRQALAKLETK
jgi:hypothetical protein